MKPLNSLSSELMKGAATTTLLALNVISSIAAMRLLFLFIIGYGFVVSFKSADVSSSGDCPGSSRTVFLRKPGWRRIGTGSIVKGDMAMCSHHCRHNILPSSNISFPCSGFNFRPGKTSECELFRNSSKPGATELIATEQLSFYFDKKCMRVSRRCGDSSAFVFDVRQGYTLRASTSIEFRQVGSEFHCAQACLDEQCIAFAWEAKYRKCLLTNDSRKENLERNKDATYYENNCMEPSSRCPPGTTVKFIFVKGADVPSFGVPVGVRSIQSCMKECIDTALLHCRSLQFDSSTNQCFVSDESSDVAVSSPKLDLYEPFCSEATNLAPSCDKAYAFEKILTSRLVNAAVLQELRNQTVESCLTACMGASKKCRAVNYDVTSTNCFLMSTSKTDKEANIVQEESFDYYEPACLLEATSGDISSTSDMFLLHENNRTLRQEFRNIQHWETYDLNTCWFLCRNATKFVCRAFSYSESRRECMLSSSHVEIPQDYEKLTQKSSTFHLYVRHGIQNLDIPTTQKPYTRWSFPTLVPDSVLRQAISANALEDHVFDLSSSLFVDDTGIRKTSPRPYTRAPTPSIKVAGLQRHRGPEQPVRESLIPNSSMGGVKSLATITDPELQQLAEFESIPRLATLSEHIGFVPPDNVKVQVECHDAGMNVTFLLKNPSEKYTGAVYAAERFEQCRVFVRSSSRFAIFIPRPQHNTWCNALEIDKIVSAVIVMSNDRVLPHDVTTKDDLFFHVTCNYTAATVNEIRQGVVVGGPSPVAIASSEVHRQISLQIMRRGHPVDSVFIGETLVARVESDISPDRLRVIECTAHRVGGTGPPTSVGLIADGCALLPSLMSPMTMGAHGWESSLSAFRIDGSEQIDVVCMVAVCPDESCPQQSCTLNKDRPTRSLEDEHPVRVDRRLIVKARALQDLEKDDHAFSELCLQPPTYLSALTLLALSLIIMATCICVGVKRRSNSMEDLLSISQISTPPRDLGAKYIRTLSA
ncbi:hypothetical protein V3C99_009084 [Haemonchus contortus]